MSSSTMSSMLLVVFVLLSTTFSSAHNITAILNAFPEYSEYNRYLTETKVSDEINSRQTITCLVLPNPAMTSLAGKHPLSAIKSVLRLLTLLDYFDSAKLHAIAHGTVLVTTLLQTTGNTQGNLGFVNITNLRGGKVGFGSTAPSSKLDSLYTKSVKQTPYTISVLEISAPIVFPGLLDAPAETANLTAVLQKAGCKTFSALIMASGVLKMYESAMEKGLTVFAPNDEAFKASEVPDLSRLSQAELVTLLQFHALPSYSPKASLKMKKGPIPTLASSGAGKFDLRVVTRGDDVSLDTGVDTSRVASDVLDNAPVCVLSVDSVLLPEELFGKAPAPAPAPGGGAPASAPGPGVESPSPAPGLAPSPEVEAPAAEVGAPAGGPVEGPDGSPAGSPEQAADENADGSAAVGRRVGWGLVLAGVLASVMSS